MTLPATPDGLAGAEELLARCARLERELAREKAARRAAEDIAEQGLRDLYLGQERLRLLTRIASFANDCADPADALRFAAEQVRDHLGWAVGHALIVAGEPGNERLEGTDLWSLRDPQLFFPFIDASRNLIAWPGDVLPGGLFSDPQATWVANVRAQAGFTRAPAARRCHLSGAMAVPVLAGRELVAALEFFQTDANPPDPAMLDILGQIGAQIGRVFARRRFADQLLRGATTDPLTQLPNRAALERSCDERFHPDRVAGTLPPPSDALALLCIGVDGLQLVNDTLGHAAGDALLVAIADRLRRVVAGVAAQPAGPVSLARLGGNMFALLLSAADPGATAAHVAQAVHAALAPAFPLQGRTVHLRTHVGIALDRPDYRGLDELLRDADVALVAARAAGDGHSIVFADAMRAEAIARLELEAELRAAIEGGQFELHYQPIVAMADRRVLGFEALVRWRRTPDQLVMPDRFIGLAETTGLIIPIGTWVLREACRAVVRLRARAAGQPPVYVAVNVAAQQFQQANFVGLVRDILLETGADPAWLRLELTETSAMANPDHARQTVSDLKAMGIKVSLDDFGTGYSSLAYLQAIPFDTIKVDAVFVRHQVEDKADWSIVTAVKALADAMGMQLVIEGVESEYQRTGLARLGCAVGQGYLFNRPLAEEEAAARAGLGPEGHDKRARTP